MAVLRIYFSSVPEEQVMTVRLIYREAIASRVMR